MSESILKAFYKMDDSELVEKFKSEDAADIREFLDSAMKQQDRDTRHACAEALLGCDEDVSGYCIWKTEAYSAVVSCRDGLMSHEDKG